MNCSVSFKITSEQHLRVVFFKKNGKKKFTFIYINFVHESPIENSIFKKKEISVNIFEYFHTYYSQKRQNMFMNKMILSFIYFIFAS